VLACRVNQASFAYPITTAINFDGITSGSVVNVEPGMLVVFGTAAGKDDRGRTVVKGITSNTLGIPRISQGIVDGTVNLADDLHITIYDFFPIFAKIPYIDKATGTTFKDGDRAFLANMPPIANIGYAHIYARNVNPSTNLLTLTIDSTDSFATMGGATLSSRLWDIKDGSYTVGGPTSTIITVTFPVGRRVVKLTLTDSNGQVQIRHLTVVACKDGTAYAAITDFTPGTLTQTVEGLRMSFKLGKDLPATTYLDRTAVCYWREDYFNSSTSQQLNSTSVVKFAGWLRNVPSRVDAQPTHLLRESTLECVDTCGELAQLAGFPQAIERVATPIRWEEQSDPNIDRFLVYLWLFHSYAPGLADFMWTGVGSSYPIQRLNSGGTNLYAQIDGRAKAIGYRLLSTAKGRARCKKDPLLFDSGDRDSTNTVDILEGDWKFLGWTHQRPSRSHWARGSAIIASATAYEEAFCRAPGSVPAQGPAANDIGEMLVTSHVELEKRVGHAYARENSFFSYFEVEFLHGADIGLEPLDFVRLNMSADTAAQRGHTFANQRCMIVAIYTDTENTYGTSRVRATLEVETFGTPAENEPPEPDDTPNIEQNLFPPDDFLIENTSDLHKGVKDLAAIGSDGNIYRTHTFTRPSGSGGPIWDSVASGMSGTPVQAVPYAFSPKYLETGTAVNAIVATMTGIYTVGSIEATPSANLRHTFRATSSKRSMDFSFGTVGYGVCVSAYTDGVYATKTTDGGVTWSTEALVGAATDLDTYSPGAYMSSKSLIAYLSAVSSGVGEGYKGTLPTPSYAALGTPDINPGGELAGEIHVPFGAVNENVVFHGRTSTGTPGSRLVTFDSGGDIYTVLPIVGVPNLVAEGNPGNCLMMGPGDPVVVAIRVILPGPVTVTEMSLDYKKDHSGGLTRNFFVADIDGNNLDEHHVSSTPTNDTWFTETWSGISVSDAYSVVFTVDSSAGTNLQVFLDNCYVEYTTVTGRGLIRIESNGSAKIDISPIVGGESYGPWQSRGQVVSDATNQNLMAFALANDDLSLAGIWVSRNRGDTMEEVIAPLAAGSRYERVAISSDGNGAVYLMGEDGKVGYMNSLDDTPDERGPGGSATIIAVMGL
jgi:hypothetical protein